MRALFQLAELGVRVIFVPVLAEGCLYLASRRLLLIAEGISPERRARAAEAVLKDLAQESDRHPEL
jgi:hypothetical protein